MPENLVNNQLVYNITLRQSGICFPPAAWPVCPVSSVSSGASQWSQCREHRSPPTSNLTNQRWVLFGATTNQRWMFYVNQSEMNIFMSTNQRWIISCQPIRDEYSYVNQSPVITMFLLAVMISLRSHWSGLVGGKGMTNSWLLGMSWGQSWDIPEMLTLR